MVSINSRYIPYPATERTECTIKYSTRVSHLYTTLGWRPLGEMQDSWSETSHWKITSSTDHRLHHLVLQQVLVVQVDVCGVDVVELEVVEVHF